MDETGHIWVGHFDENPVGIRRWSTLGRLAWTSDGAAIPGLFDCYALNVLGTAAWACPYTDFPLVEIRPDRLVRVWSNRIRGAHAVAVRGDRVAFYGGYGEERDRLAHAELTETFVELMGAGLLALPDGCASGRRWVVGGWALTGCGGGCLVGGPAVVGVRGWWGLVVFGWCGSVG
ncbi:hypothetical protein [Streptomyces triticiradicis]|uniref:hypothetical protein n=1 Tax=Streptomyces triticiradicis TaxID=2651189 RepID=UPI001CEC237F|nr:hypothetical protein [Streptomyces triticiradicis]